MRELDKQEQLILRELIKDPRLSDNQLSKRAKVPLKTVNRKRKLMESEGFLYYFTFVDHSPQGTGIFASRQMYVVHMKPGITRKWFQDELSKQGGMLSRIVKHILYSHLGETDGHLVLFVVIESHKDSDILEIFNAEILSELKSKFGEDSVRAVQSYTLSSPIRVLHNYLPGVNLEGGKIKQGWPENSIFVC